MREHRTAWNKGRLLGQKPPLKPKEISSLRIRLQLANKGRDLALFNLAIDSKLRGSDLVSLRVRDVTKNIQAIQLLLGHTKLESTVRGRFKGGRAYVRL